VYKCILVATDGSELSKKAVNSAIALAVRLGSELIAVKVVPQHPQSYFEGTTPLSPEDVDRLEKHWSGEGHEVVEAVREAGAVQGIKVEPIVARSDDVSDALIAVAKEHNADLIVMASHGRKGVKRLLLGSETQQVLTHSEIPVLVLR